MRSCRLYIILLLIAIYSCTVKDEITVDFDEVSSEIGPEGGEIKFFKKNLPLEPQLFPSIKIAPETFDETTIVSIVSTLYSKSNTPTNFGLISRENYGWSFKHTSQANKPVTIELFYDEPAPENLLEGQESKFCVYSIHEDELSTDSSNWVKVTNANHSPPEKKFTITDNVLGKIYFISYEEIQRYDVWNLVVTERQRDWNFLNNDWDYFNFKTHLQNFNYNYFNAVNIGQKGFIKEDNTYTFENFSNGSHSVNNSHVTKLTFDSTSSGLTNVVFSYDFSDNIKGKFVSKDAPTITIKELGNVGEQVIGNISGWIHAENPQGEGDLFNNTFDFPGFTDSLYIEYSFDVKRTR